MSEENARFVWFDLMTTDVKGAESFYTDIIGWKAATWQEGHYDLWKAGDEDVGGVMPLDDQARAAGAPPQWLAYIATRDVDATVQKAKKLGGKVLAPPTDIPNVGRYAMLADPQGASFGVFQARHLPAPEDAAKPGHFGWAELNTTDWKAAWKFYSDLFGWKHTTSMDMGPDHGEYFMFGLDEKQAFGGMSNSASVMHARPHWLHYVNVKNADETAKRVTEKGGQGLQGPMDVPGGGRIAQCLDPQGARFAVFSPTTQR